LKDILSRGNKSLYEVVEALSFQITQDPEFYFKIDEQIDELLETQ